MAATAPYILVPMRIAESGSSKGTSRFIGVWESYLTKIYKYSAVPLLVPLALPISELNQLYTLAHGLLLTGGEDIAPEWYNASPHPKNTPISLDRDNLELELTRRCMKDKKPILGICRGCQVMAVSDGGTLHQHIPDINQNEEHNFPDTHKKHEVSLFPTSQLFHHLKNKTIAVNSFHHQAINDPGTNFSVTATSPGGIVEGIEHRDPTYFCIGVQSHPESEDGDMEKLFEAFILACRSSMGG